jgi:NADH:ubiquinone reductase (H+-translocating)
MQRIVIVGGGFAGFWAALGAARVRAEARAQFTIQLVSRDPRLVLRPRLYEQAPDRLTVDLPPRLAAVDVEFIQAEVTGIAADRIALADGAPLAFDRLVLAAGSVGCPAPVPGLLPLDTLADAERLTAHLKGQPASATVVVVGAGFTGLEIATELAARFRVVLIDRASVIGASLGDGPQPAIAAALAQLGIEACPGVEVTTVTADAVRLSDGTEFATRTAIWAGGLRASPLTAMIDAERDGRGRLVVDGFLRVPGQGHLFAAGDVAAASAVPGHRTLLSCQHAMPLGRVAGHNAARSLLGLDLIPFAAPVYVTCLDLGGAGGMLSIGWQRRVLRTGAAAKLVKQSINRERIVPPPPDRAALLAAAALDTGRPATEAGFEAYFDSLIAAKMPA